MMLYLNISSKMAEIICHSEEEFLAIFERQDLCNIIKIVANGLGLKQIPESIGQCVALQELHVSYNQLQTIPESIGHCIALQELHVSENRLQTLPESIGHCVSIKNIYVS